MTGMCKLLNIVIAKPKGRGGLLELKLRILEIQAHARGKHYKIGANGKTVSIVLTFHALERTQRWKLTEQQVVRASLAPEEVLKGTETAILPIVEEEGMS
jgi:hypothetical protein